MAPSRIFSVSRPPVPRIERRGSNVSRMFAPGTVVFFPGASHPPNPEPETPNRRWRLQGRFVGRGLTSPRRDLVRSPISASSYLTQFVNPRGEFHAVSLN